MTKRQKYDLMTSALTVNEIANALTYKELQWITKQYKSRKCDMVENNNFTIILNNRLNAIVIKCNNRKVMLDEKQETKLITLITKQQKAVC